jgi:hypothetical protein
VPTRPNTQERKGAGSQAEEGAKHPPKAFLTGAYQAARISMLMPPVTASQAAALNLVAEVVPDSELDTTAADLARRLAEGPTRGYAARPVEAVDLAGVGVGDCVGLMTGAVWASTCV